MHLSFNSIMVCGALMGLTYSIPSHSHAAPEFPRETFEMLDTGIYWFGDAEAYQKAEPGQDNPYFDPQRPTIIYVHGWQNGSTARQFREAFDWSDSGAPPNYLAQAWLDQGWNIGVMYWNQLADENDVAHAEAKIWVPDGPQGMRWRDVEGNYHADGPSVSAGELFYNNYRDAMAQYTGDEIRIAGHSLGNQMAINLTYRIVQGVASGELPATAQPRRVALLDPFYSPGERDYLDGRWTGEVARDYAAEAIDAGIAFEVYRTSVLSRGGDSNDDLMALTAFVELKPWYFNSFQIAEKHVVGAWHYFWSFDTPVPAIRDSSDPGLSARTTDARVFELMQSRFKLEQWRGSWTMTPADDIMQYLDR